jgi:hypothetical protein
MKTPRERVLKAINHIEPEIVPIHIMGFDPVERRLEHFDLADHVELRGRLGLDIQEIRAVWVSPNAEQTIGLWGQEVGPGGADGAGYSSVRGGYPLADAVSVADIDGF